jgi:AcrR family transcriptional regulator
MSPRAYRAASRRESVELTRRRIIEAARNLLTAPRGLSAFTIDAVAREAGVARMTVYYQFGSKLGLLEAIYDDLAARGLVEGLPSVLQAGDGAAALDELVDVFFGFWASDRLLIRRLRALGALDPEVEAGIKRRDAWRRLHCLTLLQRLRPVAKAEQEALADLFAMLTSFESYDALAGPEDAPAAPATIVKRLARASLAAADPGRRPLS